MRKRMISLLVASAILSIAGTTAFAEEAKKIEAAKPIVTEMTLQEAIKYAGEHNSTIRDLKKGYNDYYDTYTDVEKATNKVKNRPNGISVDLDSTISLSTIMSALSSSGSYSKTTEDDYAIYKGYSLENSENLYNDLLKAKESAEQGIYYGIEQLTYDIEKTEKDIEYYKNTKKKLEKDLLISQIMLKLKMITNLQYSKAKNAISQMDSTIKITNNILEAKKNALKGFVGIDRNTDLKVKHEKLEYKAIKDLNLEDITKQALEKRADALKARHKLRGKELDFLVYDYEKNAIAFDTYNDAQIAFENEKNDYENGINDIKFNVQKVYDALISSQNAYNDALESLNNTDETHRINKLKYANGMISTIELMGSELAYQKAQIDLYKALSDNVLANKRFELACTIADPDATAGQ